MGVVNEWSGIFDFCGDFCTSVHVVFYNNGIIGGLSNEIRDFIIDAVVEMVFSFKDSAEDFFAVAVESTANFTARDFDKIGVLVCGIGVFGGFDSIKVDV